jgi:hypothetical protein
MEAAQRTTTDYRNLITRCDQPRRPIVEAPVTCTARIHHAAAASMAFGASQVA